MSYTIDKNSLLVFPKLWIESNAINPLTSKNIKLLPYQIKILKTMYTPNGLVHLVVSLDMKYLGSYCFPFGTLQSKKLLLLIVDDQNPHHQHP